LTEEQRAELGFDDRATGSVDQSVLYNGPVSSCLFKGVPARPATVAVGIALTAGVERYAGDDVDVNLRQVVVQGFPAVVAVPRRYHDYCVLVVDTGPGQLLEVQYGDVAIDPPVPQDELCTKAEEVADSAMMTLLQAS
jgi:hypothetical protein